VLRSAPLSPLASYPLAVASKKPKKPNQQEVAAKAAAERLGVEDCFTGAEEAVEDVRTAAEELSRAATLARARYCFRQIVGTGRTVTWALQHLKYKLDDPARWPAVWASATSELTRDPVATWLYEARNAVVKDGQHGLAQDLFADNVRVRYMTLPWSPEAPPPDAPPGDVMAYMQSAPPMQPGGRTVQYPTLSFDVDQRFYVEGAPEWAKGRDLGELGLHYARVLHTVVLRTRRYFPSAAGAPGGVTSE